jgi:hypothetical protein
MVPAPRRLQAIVKRLLSTLLALLPASTALAWPSFSAEAPQTPHPAVVRVVTPNHDGVSMGSGFLAAVNDSHGLVVTNWHVVRDASGPITVLFPDGFGSAAVVLSADRIWDLAALAVRRPNAAPIPLATEPTRPGELLAIAGYGPNGVYRAVSGRCTKYWAPETGYPRELVEVDVAARSGDSGGPIFNARGEVAGVLFGANDSFLTGGFTMGSYCGRVRGFLVPAYAQFQRLGGSTQQIAQARPPIPAAPPAAICPAPATRPAERVDIAALPATAQRPLDSGFARQFVAVPQTGQLAPSLPPPAAVSPPTAIQASAAPLPTRAEQFKTILAAIGVLALLFHSIRLVGAAVG